MPRHIVRLLLVMAVVALAAVTAKIYFTDPSYGLYGRYRGDAVAEIAADEPLYKGSSYCQSCHGAQHSEWSAGVHKVVNCETCHGAAVGHPAGKQPAAPAGKGLHGVIAAGRQENVKLIIPPDSVKLCTLCHEKMPGRPATQRQIVVSSHAGTQQCIVCHNPHSPRLIATGAAQAVKLGDAAAGRKKASVCAGCHGAQGVSANPVWPSLAGQHGEYLVGALHAYKSKARSDPLMTAQAMNLSEADISDLGAHFASLSCKAAPPSGPAQAAAAGKAKAAACAACHGAGGVSPNPVWPNLAGQHEAYLVNALKAYRTGTRQNPMMAGMAKGLSDTDIGQLAAYFASLSCR